MGFDVWGIEGHVNLIAMKSEIIVRLGEDKLRKDEIGKFGIQ